MNCKICGGTTSPNPRKVPTKLKPVVNPKLPDFICNQDAGKCGSDVQYTNYKGEVVDGFNPTPAWKPKEGGFDQYATRPTPNTPMTPAPAGQDGYVPATPIVNAHTGQPVFVPPQARQPVVVERETRTVETVPEQTPDWGEIGRQKNRSNLAAAVLHGKELNWETLTALEAWVLSGKTPTELAGQPTDLDEIASSIPF